jgi:uncharacterized protein (TIGR02328 family)
LRLWHEDLIAILPRQQLLGQHREIAALRGLGWGRKHSTVNYVFIHEWEMLFNFHLKVMNEMKARGYQPNPTWYDFYYRGKRCEKLDPNWIAKTRRSKSYPEHNKEYLKLCIENLTKKIKEAPAGKYEETEVYKFYTWCNENGFKFD